MRRWRISVAQLLLGLFGLLMVVGFSALGYIAVKESRASLVEHLDQYAQNSMASLTNRLTTRLRPVADQLAYLSGAEVAQVIADNDFRRLGQTLNGALAATPQVQGLGFFGREGTLTYANRDNWRVMIGEWRQRSMSQIRHHLKQQPEGLVWLDPQWSDALNRTILPAAMPVSLNGEYLGLMIAVIAIEDLSEFLAELQQGASGVPFVLFDATRVLAYPLMTYRLTSPLAPEQALPDPQTLDDPVLQAYTAGESTRFKLIDLETLRSDQVQVDGERYILLTQVLEGKGLPAWVVGTYFSWRLMEQNVDRIYLILGAGLVLMLLMMGVALWFSRRIGESVSRIVQAFDSLAHEEVSRVPQLQGSRIAELDRIADAFNTTVHSLRDFECVKSQFVRYVPDPVVDTLLKSRGVLEPQETVATVLFCDLQRFTQLSQQVTPAEIVEILNSYFSVIAERLEAEGGVITQFQGDAVLAIFNVPLPLEQHAARAVNAARAILASVDSQRFCGHELNCRIGICTGPVLAGVVGAKDRVNYTVHGDTVNMAARLEALNKAHSTRILMDEATALALPESLRVNTLGEIRLRGRQGLVRIFTPAPD